MSMEDYLQYGFALIVVIILILAVAWVLRRATVKMAGRSRMRRLAVLESIPIDPKRRLILIERDDVQHLLLVGGSVDVVVEQGFSAPMEASGPPLETGRFGQSFSSGLPRPKPQDHEALPEKSAVKIGASSGKLREKRVVLGPQGGASSGRDGKGKRTPPPLSAHVAGDPDPSPTFATLVEDAVQADVDPASVARPVGGSSNDETDRKEERSA